MKNFLKRFILNLIMLIVVLMLPALAITVLVIVLQCINCYSGTELFLFCMGVFFYILFVYSLIITIFQKIDVLENKIKKNLNIYE